MYRSKLIPKNPSAIQLLRNKKNKELHHFSNTEELQFSPLTTITHRYAEIEKKLLPKTKNRLKFEQV